MNPGLEGPLPFVQECQRPALAQAILREWLGTIRAGHRAVDGGIWTALLAQAGGAAQALSLRQALENELGVAVLDDDVLPDSSMFADAPGAWGQKCGQAPVRLRIGTQVYGLCEDPWCLAAIRACAREPALKLALALPGQLARLCAAESTSPPVQPEALPVHAEAAIRSPIIGFVDEAIAQAYANGASDIHFENDRAGLGVKYRVDGVMEPGHRLEASLEREEVISRIKVLAQLDITERRRPQDGRIHWEGAAGQVLDLRVSVMPGIFGEDAVLRLLDKAQDRSGSVSEQSRLTLDTLGFDMAMRRALRDLARRPHGMLLMTGPTGSGKTTTVYAALSEVNDGLEKIITIEDPVEYELPGVLQIPVNEQKGLTFATGLRSILRHDPDKILVGEIRDAETAEIAVQSALTGHLVFTTVHANSLADVLGRFQHFGIEPFALASALNGVVVQRLLRRLCPHCAAWREAAAEERGVFEGLGMASIARVPAVTGCQHCRHTGYRGRFVVAEVHGLDDEMRDLIIRRTSMSEVKAAAYRQPEGRLLWQALEQVRLGVTSFEEVQRVVGLV